MNHTEFFKSIKAGDILPAYIFHGEEEFVKESAYSKLLEAVVPENRDFNVTILDTDNAQELREACETLPFMSEHRLVVNHKLPTDKSGKQLVEYLTMLPPETVLLFYIRGKADAKTSLFKKIHELGGEVNFSPLGEAEIYKWLTARAKKADLSMSQSAARYFVQLVGSDMLSVSNEMQKLVSACTTGEITNELIADIVTSNIEYKSFTMFQAFMNGNMSEGFLQLDNILEADPGTTDDERVAGVSGYLLSCFKNMLAVHDLKLSGVSRQEILSRLKMKDFALRGIEQNLHGFSREILLDAVARFSDVMYRSISGGFDRRSVLVDAICGVFVRDAD